MRCAVARSARTVARCSSDLAGRVRSLAQALTWAMVERPRSLARSSSGAPTTSAWGWLVAFTRALTAPWRVVSSTRSASRSPRRRGAGVWSKASASRAARIASTASLLAPLWRRCAGGPLGAADFDDPLAVGEQEAGQSGAIAAGALDRPASLAWDLCPGEVQQGVVAAGVGAGLGLGDDPPDRGDSGGGEGARGGCRRRRAPSTVSARMAMRLLLGEGGRGRCRPGSSVTARRNCDGSRPFGSDRLLIRPARPAPAPRQTAQRKGNPSGRQSHLESCRGAGDRSCQRSSRTAGSTLTVASGDQHPRRPPLGGQNTSHGIHDRPLRALLAALGVEPASTQVLIGDAFRQMQQCPDGYLSHVEGAGSQALRRYSAAIAVRSGRRAARRAGRRPTSHRFTTDGDTGGQVHRAVGRDKVRATGGCGPHLAAVC